MLVPRSALTTSSAADSGTSTREKRSAISIAPISLPERYDSPVIAPTRSCGRTPPERPCPRTGVSCPQSRGDHARVTAVAATGHVVWPFDRGGGRPRRHFDGRDLFFLARCSAASWASLTAASATRRGQTPHERPDNSPEGIKVAVVFEQALAELGSHQLQAHGPQLGDGRQLLDRDRPLVTRSMVLSILCSRGSVR